MARRRRAARSPWTTPKLLDLLEPALEAVPVAEPSTPDAWMSFFCGHPLFAELSMSWGQIARASRATAVDVFRDPELVAFVATIDPVVRAHGGVGRGLYRLALRGLVPESLRARRDKALGHPLAGAAAVAAGAVGELEALGSLDELAGLGLVEPGAFRAPFASWLRALRRGERLASDATDASFGTECGP